MVGKSFAPSQTEPMVPDSQGDVKHLHGMQLYTSTQGSALRKKHETFTKGQYQVSLTICSDTSLNGIEFAFGGIWQRNWSHCQIWIGFAEMLTTFERLPPRYSLLLFDKRVPQPTEGEIRLSDLSEHVIFNLSQFAWQGAKNANKHIAKTVTGVRRVKRAFLERHGLELLGRDETHEYFARALPEEEMFGRDFDYDDLLD
ncbi:hypothetical protein BKA70DRAFT_1242605 [Coprinopsis sp. MPI-PUGE-AT-0042]|nr:hypothetical protein BKA70DRAFT_1242605 [Coprinopsis sp. MPI-PUGE-AT-0042]